MKFSLSPWERVGVRGGVPKSKAPSPCPLPEGEVFNELLQFHSLPIACTQLSWPRNELNRP
jgi:hypothetical protein